MKALARLFLPLAAAASLTGCLTQQQLVERRIGEKAAFFSALPAASQQRLREGRLEAGDTRDAAWIVYGRPDRVFQKATASSTNEVWSYVTQAFTRGDEPRPAYHPVRTGRGWRGAYSTMWAPAPELDTYEYIRIEFAGDRVLSIQAEAPAPAKGTPSLSEPLSH